MGQKLNTKVNKKYKLENKKDYKLIDYYKFRIFWRKYKKSSFV